MLKRPRGAPQSRETACNDSALSDAHFAASSRPSRWSQLERQTDTSPPKYSPVWNEMIFPAFGANSLLDY